MNWLDGVSTTLLHKGLDGVWARQKAIDHNLSNYETPGFKKSNVSFEDELREVINSKRVGTRSEMLGMINSTKPTTTIDKSTSLRADGNNVDIDAENIELARVQLQYSTYTRQISDSFSRLRYAISGGTK